MLGSLNSIFDRIKAAMDFLESFEIEPINIVPDKSDHKIHSVLPIIFPLNRHQIYLKWPNFQIPTLQNFSNSHLSFFNNLQIDSPLLNFEDFVNMFFRFFVVVYFLVIVDLFQGPKN